MAPDESADPQAAYAVASALMALRLEELRSALQAHEVARPIDWARVSELRHVELLLGELVRYVGPT